MQKLIYINKFTGSAFGTRQNRRFTYRGKINLHSGANRIALLSVAVGLPVSLLLLFSSANCFFFVSLILIHLFLKPEECGWTLWVMEYWNLGTSGFARVVSRETWSVMAKMDLPGVLSFPSDSSLSRFPHFSCLTLFSSGGVERRSYESCVSNQHSL